MTWHKYDFAPLIYVGSAETHVGCAQTHVGCAETLIIYLLSERAVKVALNPNTTNLQPIAQKVLHAFYSTKLGLGKCFANRHTNITSVLCGILTITVQKSNYKCTLTTVPHRGH